MPRSGWALIFDLRSPAEDRRHVSMDGNDPPISPGWQKAQGSHEREI